MHIPDAVLDPRVAIATGLVGAAGLGYGLRTLRERLGDRTTVLMGSMAAFVFAAQMVNFPLLVIPASGHLLGGVLAAVVLGPWAGASVVAAVLLVQCFLFGDGGLTALGANFVNMGLVGSVGGYAIYRPIRRAIGGPRGVLVGSMAASWFSVILASGAFAVELAASGRWSNFVDVLGWMALVHSLIGLGEALITGMVVRYILLTRPDLIDDPEPSGAIEPRRWVGVGASGLGIALAVAIFLAPLASKAPDGLEFVGGSKVPFLPPEGSAPAATVPSPIPDYAMPGLSGSRKLATAVAGLVGTVVVFGVAFGLARSLGSGRRPGPIRGREGVAPDAI